MHINELFNIWSVERNENFKLEENSFEYYMEQMKNFMAKGSDFFDLGTSYPIV